MKFVVLIVVVLIIVWLVRGKRPQAPAARPVEPAPHEPMLACAQCGLHLPKGEALPGRGGVFCSESHRTAYERAHPPA